MEMFHGTGSEFEAFDSAHLGGGCGVATGFVGHCFTTKREDAMMYALPHGILITAEVDVDGVYEIPYDYFLDLEQSDRTSEEIENLKAEAKGYDVIHVQDTGVYIVLNPDVIEIVSKENFR